MKATLVLIASLLLGCGGGDDDGGGEPDARLALIDARARVDSGAADAASSDGGGPRAVGEPCTDHVECAGSLCVTEYPGGYCSQDCTADGLCPPGSECFGLGGKTAICFKTCAQPSECREGEGYTCDADMTCYPAG